MDSQDSLLAQLNDMQRAAVEYNDGPLLVIAGAGAGKTRMLTYKIAYLIRAGVAPWTILALTFTNKAANEMKARIAALVGNDRAQYINMGTFHAICARLLSIEAAAIGYNSHFTIYDEGDSQSLLRVIIKELALDDKIYKPAAVHRRISLAKNNMLTAAQYAADGAIYERDRYDHLPYIGQIFSTYEQRCQMANALDFDDLLLQTYQLFRAHDDIRTKWEQKFQHILVDEYQDTNKVQQAILCQLTRQQQHICVVGDDAQSIYAFRGANIDNILLFQQVYPGAQLFKLERNYRSTQTIVHAANSLIANNQRQISKTIFSENARGDRLVVRQAHSDTEEAAIVCNNITRLCRDEGCTYADCAVLYRTNAQSRIFEEALLKRDIPYKVYGGVSFYQRREIKDILAYIRLVINPDDEEALRRIINYPARGIGNTTIARLRSAANNAGVSLWQVCCNIDDYATFISAATQTKIRRFVELIDSFRARLTSDDAYTLGHDIILRSGIYSDIFASTDVDAVVRQENINEFDTALNDFIEEKKEENRPEELSLTHFMQEVSLQSDRESNNDNTTSVALMTVHAAKGLEFLTVFIVGLEENIFPSLKAASSQREIEEERRLLYVALTRAIKHCFLTYAKHRWRYGKMESFVPSRFISEIDKQYLDIEDNDNEEASTISFAPRRRGFAPRIQNAHPVASQFRADIKYKVTAPLQKETPADPFTPAFRRQLAAAHKPQKTARTAHATLHVGSIINHQRFGRGTVTAIRGEGDDTKAVVNFKNIGTKVLMLKYAKYSVVE